MVKNKNLYDRIFRDKLANSLIIILGLRDFIEDYDKEIGLKQIDSKDTKQLKRWVSKHS